MPPPPRSPHRSGSVSVHTWLRQLLYPVGFPSLKGELANRAVATGCSSGTGDTVSEQDWRAPYDAWCKLRFPVHAALQAFAVGAPLA